jgi:hypothetical protein
VLKIGWVLFETRVSLAADSARHFLEECERGESVSEDFFMASRVDALTFTEMQVAGCGDLSFSV